MSKEEELWFVYDGKCPICSAGASFYRLKQSGIRLRMLDARKDGAHPLMREINAAGLDLDRGMVVKFRGRLYHGAPAMHFLAQAGSDEGIFNRVNRGLFLSERRVRALYPALKAVRDIVLKVRGIGKIDNLRARRKDAAI